MKITHETGSRIVTLDSAEVGDVVRYGWVSYGVEVADDMFEKLRRGQVKPKRAIGASGHPLGSKYHVDNGRLRTDPFEVPTK